MVDVDVQGDVYSSIILETPATASYLKEAAQITLLFKETEVSIGKNLSGLISLRNRFKGIIKRIEESKILTKVFISYKNFEIISIISARSAQRLELQAGDEIEWLVKTNEVSLLKEA